MVELFGNGGSDRAGGQAKEESQSVDWHHLWHSVQDAGARAGSAIKQQVSQIDTRELEDKAKHYADEGVKIARGKSDNRQVNTYSDVAARYLPGAELLRKGADIAHETGAEGKFLEGRKGSLHAPSENSLKELGREAVGSAVPLPGGRILSNEVLRQAGDQLPGLKLEDRNQHDAIEATSKKVSGWLHSLMEKKN